MSSELATTDLSVADANRIFIPPTPTSKPGDLYRVSSNLCNIPGYRFVCSTNPSEMLMFVDGSSLDNGSATARAGYGVVYAPLQWSPPISNRLEEDGNPQTSNRAELRAVLASLTLRFWAGEGFSTIVLACDSEYVVKGISAWILKWRTNGWKTTSGNPVANQDLWKKMEEKLREMEGKGMLVKFWKIPGEWNEADRHAKAGAAKDRVVGKVGDVFVKERLPEGVDSSIILSASKMMAGEPAPLFIHENNRNALIMYREGA